MFFFNALFLISHSLRFFRPELFSTISKKSYTISPMFSSIHTIEAREYLCDILAKATYAPEEADSVAKILFEDAFGIKKFTKEQFLTYSELSKLEKYVKKLADHLPIQYVLGEADFYGHKFVVNKDVLIPRQETEELVHLVENFLKKIDTDRKVKILDIGTGSGCIPISLAKKFPNAEITAVDVSLKALLVAKKNAKNHKVKINFLNFDFLNKNNWEQLDTYDIIISNPPYIPNEEKKIMPKRVIKFEPHISLFVEDSEPLIFYTNICEFAKEHLNPNGRCLLECNEFNATLVEEHFKNNDFSDVVLEKDISGKNRILSSVNRMKVAG